MDQLTEDCGEAPEDDNELKLQMVTGHGRAAISTRREGSKGKAYQNEVLAVTPAWAVEGALVPAMPAVASDCRNSRTVASAKLSVAVSASGKAKRIARKTDGVFIALLRLHAAWVWKNNSFKLAEWQLLVKEGRFRAVSSR